MIAEVDELRKLSKMLIEDPDKVEDLSPEKLAELKKFASPYGPIAQSPADKIFANLSIINWRDVQLRKFYMMSASAFAYRALSEYEAPEAEKTAIKKFLDRNFLFDVDRHVRSAATPTAGDPERKTCPEILAAADTARKAVAKIATIPDATLREYSHNVVMETYQNLIAADTAMSQAFGILSANAATADHADLLCSRIAAIRGLRRDAAKYAQPMSADGTRAAVENVPPVDLFHHFERYVTNNFEALREAYQAVFCEKHDIEFSVILYSAHKTEEEAREYRVKHNEEFKADVLTVESGATCLLGPFKGNRDRVDFYNANTEVIKRMAEQMEQDHKLGKDLMDKRIKVQKARNVAECGPDAPGLKEYISALGTLSAAKDKKPAEMTAEERDAVEKAKAAKEDFLVPDNAIQVDVFAPRETADGTTVLEKSRFYTRAEAPLHMQDNSEYKNKYQPVEQELRIVADNIVATADVDVAKPVAEPAEH